MINTNAIQLKGHVPNVTNNPFLNHQGNMLEITEKED